MFQRFFSAAILSSALLTQVVLGGTTVSIGGIVQSGDHNSVSIGGTGVSAFDAVKGSGQKRQISRQVAEFDQVKSRLGADVLYKPGPEYKLILEADDNILPLITTDVVNRQLILKASRSYSTELGISITVYAPTLSRVENRGAGRTRIESLRANSLELVLSGSGDLQANGTVSDLNVRLRGSGDLDLKLLKSKNAEVELVGSGDISVYASNVFSGKIRGSGDINVFGKPQNITQRVSGSGKVLLQ